MDGPAVNIKFLNEFKLKWEENAFYSIIVIESCSLHALHRSVKTAFYKSNMEIKETLKGGFQILHNSPARCKDCESVSGLTKYPLYYCATRWAQNKLVGERISEVWPSW